MPSETLKVRASHVRRMEAGDEVTVGGRVFTSTDYDDLLEHGDFRLDHELWPSAAVRIAHELTLKLHRETAMSIDEARRIRASHGLIDGRCRICGEGYPCRKLRTAVAVLQHSSPRNGSAASGGDAPG